MVDKKGVNSQQIYTYHVAATLDPGHGLTITPAYFYQRAHADDTSAFYLDTPGLGLYDQNKEVAEPGTDTVNLVSLNIHEDFGPVQLTSVTGYLTRDAKRQEDGTFFNSSSFVALLETALVAPLPTPNVPLGQALNIIGNLPSAVNLDTHYTSSSPRNSG